MNSGVEARMVILVGQSPARMESEAPFPDVHRGGR
jgi:hypothetical protein